MSKVAAAASPGPVSILRGHSYGASVVRFGGTLKNSTNVQSSVLISGDAGGFTLLWDSFTRDPALHAPRVASGVTDVISMTEFEVCILDKSGVVHVWDLRSNKFLDRETILSGRSLLDSVFQISPGFCRLAPRPMSSSNDSTQFASASGQDAMRLRITNRSVEGFYGMNESLQSVATMITSVGWLNERFLVSGDEGGSVTLWKYDEMLEVFEKQHSIESVSGSSEPILSFAGYQTESKSVVAYGGASGIVGILELCASETETGRENDIRVLKSTRLRRDGVSGLAWRSDGRIIASGCWDSCVRILDGRLDKPKSLLRPLAVLKYHSDT